MVYNFFVYCRLVLLNLDLVLSSFIMILSNEEVVLSKFFRPLTVAKISN